MRLVFSSSLRTPRATDSLESASAAARIVVYDLTEPGIFMSFWYGALYVVIEGYRDLKLAEPNIDALLQSPNVDHLRQFRNGTFHFQKNPYSQKRVHLMASPSSVTWVQDIHKQLGVFIVKSLIDRIPEDSRAEFMSGLGEYETVIRSIVSMKIASDLQRETKNAGPPTQ